MLNLSAFREEKLILLNDERQRISQLKHILSDLSLNDHDLCSSSDYCTDEIQLKTIDDKSNIPKDVSKNVCPSTKYTSKKTNDYFSTRLMTTPLCLQFGAYEQKRRKLAEERRREYNEYLKEKAKLDSERRERYPFRRNTLLVPNYNEILEKKKLKNKEFRYANGFDLFEEPLFESPRVNYNLKNSEESKISPDSKWFFGDKDNDDEDLRITPRSRLLSTRSSRAKAEEYRNELLKQIEEKKRRERIEKEMAEEKETKTNVRIEEQRQRMSAEFKEEQTRLGNKQLKAFKKETARLSAPHCYTPRIKTSKDLGSRSPSYLHVKLVKSDKQTPTKDTGIRENHIEARTISERENSLAALEEPGDTQMKTLTEKESVLARLSEVRKKMQEDHLTMLQQLRDRQIL